MGALARTSETCPYPLLKMPPDYEPAMFFMAAYREANEELGCYELQRFSW